MILCEVGGISFSFSRRSLKISKIWVEPSIEAEILDRYRIIHDEPKANQYTIETFSHTEYMRENTLELYNLLNYNVLFLQ